MITISESSKASLRGIGLHGPIFVIPMCTDEAPEPVVPAKSEQRDIVVLGRVTPSKRIEESIRASAMLKAAGWTGELLIAGGGGPKYREMLERIAVENAAPVRFLGRVSMDERRNLLRSCSVLWMTSVREGWGLVVTEAACHGTPSVVYDIPGLRDSVTGGVTGFITRESPKALADQTWRLMQTNLPDIARNALEASRHYSWDETADEFEMALMQVMRDYRGAPSQAAVPT